MQQKFDYPIPHSFVLSLTSDCNLACDHCYARVYNEPKVLPKKVLEGILEQAGALGCFFFVLTIAHAFDILQTNNVLYGFSITVTSDYRNNSAHHKERQCRREKHWGVDKQRDTDKVD